MLLEFIAAIALGLGAAGVVMALNVALRRRLPAWLVPAVAGAAMISFMVHMEYAWAERTAGQLPEGVVVASTGTSVSWFRPWTWIKPLELRMLAVDTRRSRRNPAAPGQVMTTVVLLERWMPVREIPVVFDCPGARRADLHAGVELAADGRLEGAQWRALESGDAALRVACAGET
ncbi:MAG: hypothetical protein JJT93_02355 [Gammaproteobacteria bacterium]|nr:hypothetical protein [Gammaproteobacteria bacterium]TVQ48313.1 MAG: hypothetical protein EA371_06515 [Gammaproteobacteria bacterium]